MVGAVGTSSTSATSASAQLYKDIPGFSSRHGGSGSLFASTSARPRHSAHGGDASTAPDELEPYKSLYPARGGGPGSEKENRRARAASDKGKGVDRGGELVQAMRGMIDMEQVVSLDKRWTAGWNAPMLSSDLRPVRTPLQAKLSKRCPVCAHILIKPEQKALSTRFKIKLVAANYLPSISVFRRPPASIGSRFSAIAASTASRKAPRSGAGGRSGAETGGEDDPLRSGRTYIYEISFANPLYEPIHVKLAVARPGATSEAGPAGPPAAVAAEDDKPPPPPPPFAVNIPSPTFPISAYAEDWEYEDQEDELDDADEAEGGGEGGRSSPTKRRRKGGPGIVERKMNRTTVLMEVAIAKEATPGPLWVRFPFSLSLSRRLSTLLCTS
ncbi:hypothetical protein JCM9279_007416 [Rhodotorula babjevae]